MGDRNRAEVRYWAIVFAVPVVLVAAFLVALDQLAGHADNIWVFAASFVVVIALLFGGALLGSWIAYKIEDR